MKIKLILTILIIIFQFSFISQSSLRKQILHSDNGLGLTPPMGWNSWNKFGCNINQTLIRSTADKIIQLGLDKKGYIYINLDDCWQITRNFTNGQIVQDLGKFPSGMANLSNYIHQKNLKFGLYSDSGQKTCQGRPGSFGYQKIDAEKYAQWKVDYLKYDNCYHPNVTARLRYYIMSKALNQSRRPIFFSICNWGEQYIWQWGQIIGNSWRTTGDIQDNWNSFISILQKQVGLERYAGKGGWNDPDMLQVGNGGMTFNQYYAHFALWCALKAPLLIGCDLNNIKNQTLQILGNEQLIAINQDPLGIQARRIKAQISAYWDREVWGGPLANDKYVLIFFNKGQQITLIDIYLKEDLRLFDVLSYTQRDPIRKKNISITNNDQIQVQVDRHSVQVRILKLNKNVKQNHELNELIIEQ